jgi:hypothetical protein
MIIGGPFLDDVIHIRIVKNILLTIVFINGIYAIGNKTHHLILAIGLALPMLISLWLHYVVKIPHIIYVGEIFGALFIGLAITILINYIFNAKEVTEEVLYAAVIVYLLTAILWSFAYSILEFVYPDSFGYPGGPREDVYRYLYFSFITITTLGYGDITPLTDKASALAILEAVFGQVYLVVIVAWLVGMHVSRRSK